MNSHLERVEDWILVAVTCEFRLGRMAEALDVSERTLRRDFQKHFGVTAKEWRDARRLEIALESLCCGEQVKSISGDTKFKHREGLSAFIKRQTGNSQ